MKFVTLTVLAAFAAAPAMAATTTTPAAKTSNQVRLSDDLNQAQLNDYNRFLETRQSAYAVSQPQVSYVEGDAENTPSDVYVLGPERDAQENSREPQPSPQLAGQPATDTPYVEVKPAE